MSRLLAADSDRERDSAWARFVRDHSRLIYYAARRGASGHDAAMDRYAYILEQLRVDDFRRLRTFLDGRASKFSTWLIVVGSRLCVDLDRRKYGRALPGREAESAARRRLVDLVGPSLDQMALATEGAAPDQVLREQELLGALSAALGELGREDRLLLRLRFEDDLPARECARVLGMPTQFHVYRRLRKVMARLKLSLVSRGVHGPDP